MTIISLNVNKRDYEISVPDGEEDELLRLSYELDKRVKELSKAVGTGNQSTLLVIAALQLIEELYESRHGNNKANVDTEVKNATASTLSQVSDKVEELTKKLEQKVA